MKIFVNPGHAPGGNPDPGAVSQNGLRESDVAADVGAAVVNYLQAAGHEAVMLQSDSLGEVCRTANSLNVDLFVSIHCNAAGNASASGAESWYCSGSAGGENAARLIQGRIIERLGLVDRGIKCAMPGVNGLYVLSNTDAPATLVEMAFISNDEDEAALRDRQDDFARAIAIGITDYCAL